jgi:hypothetical protein
MAAKEYLFSLHYSMEKDIEKELVILCIHRGTRETTDETGKFKSRKKFT